MPNPWSIPLRPVVALLALLVVASTGLVASASADAARKASVPPPTRVEVERATVAIAHLDAELATARGALRRTDRRLAAIVEETRALRVERRAVRTQLAAARAALARDVVSAYRSGDADLVGALLDAPDPATAFDHAELLQRLADRQAEAISSVRRLQARQTTLGAEAAALERSHRRLTADRAWVRAELATDRAARRVVLRGLPLEARQRAQRAAERRARAAERSGWTLAVAPPASPIVTLAAAAVPPLVQPIRGAADVEPSGVGAVALAYALTQIGTPYSYASHSPDSGFDCSGLLFWSFGQAGLGIPRSSDEIYAHGTRVAQADARPGDIVSFHGEGHVGLYLGGGLYVHSTQSGDVVRVSPLSARTDLDGFVRIQA